MTTLTATAHFEAYTSDRKPAGTTHLALLRAHKKHEAMTRKTDVPHVGVYVVMIGFFAWMMLVYALAFRHDTEAMFSVVVSAFYTVIYFAVPTIIWCMAVREDGGAPVGSFRDFLTSQFQTATGPMAGWEAAIQIWCIPAALSLAATGMTIAMRLA